MTVRVGINGFGRIGRNYLRAARASGADIEIVAVNDLTSADTLAHLLRYDSTHGRFDGEVHLEAGASRVIVSAPATDVDATFVVGVNDDAFDPAKDFVVSNASCTTNCFVPMVKVLDDAFGVESGLMTTIHAFTNDQNLLDLPHKDLRRARSAPVNIVPASSGAARATGLVLQSMQGKLDGFAFRVPVQDGSITDFTAVVPGEVTVEQVNAAFAAAASSGPLSRVLVYTEDPIVSSDIVGSPASCTFDSGLTMVMPSASGITLVKVEGWYDNEWGYANRLVDLSLVVGSTAS
jgi:glyceraldehyde 3-phosphate dehydrogenase